MQVIVHADKAVAAEAGPDFSAGVEAQVKATFERFGDRLTRVEVFVTDENGQNKSGNNDKRCVMEARPAGLDPLAASHQADSVDEAVDRAGEKLERVLDHHFGRLENPKGRPSYAGEGVVDPAGG